MAGDASPRWRMALIVAGWLLIGLSPVVGVLPGPGGIFLFAGGIALLLRNSAWARRKFARACRRWPRIGRLVNRALGRRRGVPPTPAD